MRTEQFEEGYNCLRGYIQNLLVKFKKDEITTTKMIEELTKLAEYSYYESDGKNWILEKSIYPKCDDCRYLDRKNTRYSHCVECDKFSEWEIRPELLGKYK